MKVQIASPYHRCLPYLELVLEKNRSATRIDGKVICFKENRGSRDGGPGECRELVDCESG